MNFFYNTLSSTLPGLPIIVVGTVSSHIKDKQTHLLSPLAAQAMHYVVLWSAFDHPAKIRKAFTALHHQIYCQKDTSLTDHASKQISANCAVVGDARLKACLCHCRCQLASFRLELLTSVLSWIYARCCRPRRRWHARHFGCRLVHGVLQLVVHLPIFVP